MKYKKKKKKNQEEVSRTACGGVEAVEGEVLLDPDVTWWQNLRMRPAAWFVHRARLLRSESYTCSYGTGCWAKHHMFLQ